MGIEPKIQKRSKTKKLVAMPIQNGKEEEKKPTLTDTSSKNPSSSTHL